MAPSPIIPTSFVPKQPVRATVNRPQAGTSLFSLIAFALLIISIVAAGAVFAYQTYLTGVRDANAALLEQAKTEITGTVVDEFVHTRDRFAAAKTILDNHVAFSTFLDTLESLTLQSVQFKTLAYTNTPGLGVSVRMSGTARSFNALAAQSAAIANVKELKRAIFSGISVDGVTGIVQFSFTAEVDPSLIAPKLPTAPIQTVPVSTASSTPTATSSVKLPAAPVPSPKPAVPAASTTTP